MNPPSDTPRRVATPCPTPSGDDWAKAATRDIDTYLEGLDFSLTAYEAAKISAIILEHAAPQLERLASQNAELEISLKACRENLDGLDKDYGVMVKQTDELHAQLTAANERLARLEAGIDRLVYLIENAGVENLTRGVQLGQISWMIKMNDALTAAKAALASSNNGRASEEK